MLTLTFTKVFKAEGAKNGKAWTRWDYKTAEDARYVQFSATQEVPLDVPVTIEADERQNIVSWQTAGGDVGGNAQETPSRGSEAGKTAPVDAQAPSQGGADRELRIHRQTAAKVAANLLQFFPEEEQNVETFFQVSEQLVDYFSNGVPLPF